MSKLLDLLKEVKQENLTKTDLERLHKEFTDLHSLLHLEMAELEKKEAMFILEKPEKTAVATKNAWRGTVEGQRLIELKHYAEAVSKQLSSLKNQLYDHY